jgi:predicted enzyme related to lactoylglutathione lyase
MWSHGSFHWNELMTHDVARAKAFYAGTIGWTFEPMPMPGGGTYWIAKAGDKPAGGLFVMDCPDLKDVPEQWLPYLASTTSTRASRRPPLPVQARCGSPSTFKTSAGSRSCASPAAPWSAG